MIALNNVLEFISPDSRFYQTSLDLRQTISISSTFRLDLAEALEITNIVSGYYHHWLPGRFDKEGLPPLKVPREVRNIRGRITQPVVIVAKDEDVKFHPIESSALPERLRPTAGLLECEGKLIVLAGSESMRLASEVLWDTKAPTSGYLWNLVQATEVPITLVTYKSVEQLRNLVLAFCHSDDNLAEKYQFLIDDTDPWSLLSRELILLDTPLKLHQRKRNRPLGDDDVRKLVGLRAFEKLHGVSRLLTIEMLDEINRILLFAPASSNSSFPTLKAPLAFENMEMAYDQCSLFWRALFTSFTPYSQRDNFIKWMGGGRRLSASDSLAFNPRGQQVLLSGIAGALKSGSASPSEMFERASRLPLSLDSPVWRGILVDKGNLIPRNRHLASLLVSYLLDGSSFTSDQIKQLENDVAISRESFGLSREKLPAPLR